MKNRSFLLLIATILLMPSTSWSQVSENCVLHQDLVEIAEEFDQFELTGPEKAAYCEEDLGPEGVAIAKSLVVLKNITPNEPAIIDDDAFTYKAISEKNWWAYFTNRAERFAVIPDCPEGVAAFVRPFFGNGTINLCSLFFEMNVSSQASVMMHEVRHFDGHAHVTCSQGMEEGNQGACDDNIRNKGSYAISVQTLVGMARAENVNVGDKSLLEAEAIYMAFNKFNEVPRLRLNKSIILSNQAGEVFQWQLKEDKMEAVGQLTEPSMVLRSGGSLTVYPLDPQTDAYRQDVALETDIENPGLYAKHYNSEAPLERAKYQSISYFGAGGLLKDNTLINLCDTKELTLGTTDLNPYGNVQTLMSLSKDAADQFRESYILNDKGELYRYECVENDSQEVAIEESPFRVINGAEKVVRSFGLEGVQYFLLDTGELSAAQFQGNNLVLQDISMPMTNKGWVSATPYSLPEVF